MKTEIQYIEKQRTGYPIGIGDFIMIDCSLYLIAQTRNSKIQLIAIKENDANRKNDNLVEWDAKGSTYNNLSKSVLDELTVGEDFKLVKVKLIVEDI